MARGVNTKANGIDFRVNRWDEFLKLLPQNLTDAEKAQVLANLGITPTPGSLEGCVKYDAAQVLTDAQKETAQENIGASSKEEFDDITTKITGKNLLNVNSEDILEGNYMSTNIQPNASYFLSEPIAVEAGKTYSFSSNYPVPISMRYVAYLTNKDDTTSNSHEGSKTQITVPNGSNYVRLSIMNAYRTYNLQLEEGEEATPYEPWVEARCAVNKLADDVVGTSNIKDGAVTSEKLADDVLAPSKPTPFGAISSGVQDVDAGETVNTSYIHGTKNTILIARVGEFDEIALGVGKDIFYQYKIVIDGESVTALSGESETQTWTENHGLDLGEETTIVIYRPLSSYESKITIFNDSGESWAKTFNFNGQGRPFLTNNGDSQITAKLDYVMRDINEKIWLFGDSYFDTNINNKWTYHLFSDGYTSNLISSQGGDATGAALSSFDTLLATGAKPSFAVWCMGMNGTADTGTTPNATWLSDTEDFIELCESYGIIPILATIPSVPSRNHAGRNAWVKASEHRYIDFAASVEASGSTSWKNWGTDKAMLSSDEVHPTIYGAKALYQQVLVDFPEITVLK